MNNKSLRISMINKQVNKIFFIPTETNQDNSVKNLQDTEHNNNMKPSTESHNVKLKMYETAPIMNNSVADPEENVKYDFNELQEKYESNQFFREEGDIDHKNKEFMSHLYSELQMKHPHTVKKNQVAKMSLCSKTGGFCCCRCCQKSDLESLGIGVVIYFKLMKAVIGCFFFLVVINVPIYYIYFSNHTDKIINSYTDALYKTTIGNIGSTLYNCMSFPLVATLDNPSLEIQLECNSMVISSIMAFCSGKDSQAEIDNKQRCFPFMSEYSLGSYDQCDLTEDLNAVFEAECNVTSSCILTVDMTAFQSKCTPAVGTSLLYFSYSCYEDGVNLGFVNMQISRNVCGFIVAIIDLFGILMMMLTLCCINSQQKRDYQKFIETKTCIRDFTLHLTDVLITKEDVNKEMNALVAHFNKILTSKEAKDLNLNGFKPCTLAPDFKDYASSIASFYQPKNFFIYELLYPKLTCEKLDCLKKSHKLQKKVHKLEVEKEKCNPKQLAKKEKEIDKLELQITKLKEVLMTKQEVKVVKEFYITFRNHQIAKYLETQYRRSKCTRCCMIGCCQKKRISLFYYKDKWMNISFAKDEPSNIKWENMTYSPCKRCARKFVSIVIAVIVMLITLTAILLSKYFESQLAKDFNTSVDCSYFKDTTEDQIKEEIEDTSKTPEERILTYCFCNNKMQVLDFLTNDLKEYVIPGTRIKPCADFVVSYLQYTSVNIGLIVAIPVVNTIVIMIFRCLTSFERNKTLSKDMSSNMWKIFVIRFVNTGILLVIVNIKIEALTDIIPSFPFFAGSFKDFDPGWYSKVGVVILFSMFLDIITPHAASLFEIFLNYLFRCCDSGCKCGRHVTKAVTKEDYFRIYTGPIFEIDARFASLLSSFYVTMIFSPGLPLLYVCFFLYLLLTFIFDKILMLRFYRNPPKYDLSIISNFITFSFIALVLHFGFSVWIYGNPVLLVDATANKLEKVKQIIDGLLKPNSSFSQNILARMTLGHNLVLIIAFLLVLFILVILLIVALLKAICSNKKVVISKNTSVEMGLAVSLRDLYQNFTLKVIEYNHMKKSKDIDQIKDLKRNLYEGIKFDRAFITYKLEKKLNRSLPNLIKDFDGEIDNYRKKIPLDSQGLLSGGSSYNVVFIPEFEAAGYYDILKELPRIKKKKKRKEKSN